MRSASVPLSLPSFLLMWFQGSKRRGSFRRQLEPWLLGSGMLVVGDSDSQLWPPLRPSPPPLAHTQGHWIEIWGLQGDPSVCGAWFWWLWFGCSSFLPSCSALSARLLLGRQFKIQNLSRPNPLEWRKESPCSSCGLRTRPQKPLSHRYHLRFASGPGHDPRIEPSQV